MNTIDRRAFMLGTTLVVTVPLWACGGSGSSTPPVSSQQGPTAVAKSGAQFSALPLSHALQVTSTGGTTRTFGGVGRGAGQFNYPADVAVIGDKAYVVETGNHRVQVFDGNGNSLGTIGDGVLNYPGGIATSATEVLVSDSRNARIVCFDPDGRVTRSFGEGALSAPRGLAVTADGVLVADPGLHKVLRFGTDGKLLGDLGGAWFLPYDVATDGAQIYVADASASEIAVLSLSGERVDTITLERAPTYLSYRSGTLYVV